MAQKTIDSDTHDTGAVKKRDDWLVSQAISGSVTAFESLIRFYQRRIVALGMGFFKNLADAEDFAQDVFTKTYVKLASFRSESMFSTWITRIAYNTAINMVNRRKEYETIADEDNLFTAIRGPEEVQMRKLTGEAVRETIRELPKEYAMCLDMYFFHDMSYKEISKTTELPVNTIKSHIFRAKKILRDKLVDYYHID